MASYCARLVSPTLLGGALLCLLAPAGAQAGKHAWTQAGVSSGLHSVNHAVTVNYQASNPLPPGAVITQVYAHRDYAGNAQVQTSLCWGKAQSCVDIVGRSINTRAFKGLDASQPMQLVHRVHGWQGSRPPLYIKGNVTVWYETPGPQAQAGSVTETAPPAR